MKAFFSKGKEKRESKVHHPPLWQPHKVFAGQLFKQLHVRACTAHRTKLVIGVLCTVRISRCVHSLPTRQL